MKRKLLAIALSALLTGATLIGGCGGSDGDSPAVTDDTTDTTGGGSTPDAGTGTEVSGTVEAPNGSIAVFRNKSFKLAFSDFIFSPAAAAITGLQPVTGATVELIRVDDNGAQVGDVLATTATSVTGGYTLTLPAGINLSGSLIVRITGQGGATLRAQVVEQQVNINPVSEFVLKKFIDEGVDLDNLTTASVIKLTDQVDEFDLSASADLSAMIAALEAETGEFVEDQISIVTSSPGNAESVAGNFRGAGIQMGLHDDDQQHGVGTISLDGGEFEFSLSDQGSGKVSLSIEQQEDAYSNQTTFQDSVELTFNVEIETGDDETIAARLDSLGVLSLQVPFEEDIDGEFGWRSPPSIERFQKAKNSDVLVASFNDALVRYKTVDTNNDNVKDAIDPAQREGDEVFKGLQIAVKKPTSMTAADMTGDFGLVSLQVELGSAGSSIVQTEKSVLGFNGTGQIDVGASQGFEIARSTGGVAFTMPTEAAETGVPITFSADGDIPSIGGDDADGFVNDSFDLMVVSNIESEDDNNSQDELVDAVNFGTTVAVKLPDSQLDISNKVYRVFFLGIITEQQATALNSFRFNSFLTMNNDNTSATLVSDGSEIEKATAVADITSSNEAEDRQDAAVTVATNGDTTIAVTADDGVFTLDGYLSHDGSMGVFQQRWIEDGDANPIELGMVLLVEVDPTAAN